MKLRHAIHMVCNCKIVSTGRRTTPRARLRLSKHPSFELPTLFRCLAPRRLPSLARAGTSHENREFVVIFLDPLLKQRRKSKNYVVNVFIAKRNLADFLFKPIELFLFIIFILLLLKRTMKYSTLIVLNL